MAEDGRPDPADVVEVFRTHGLAEATRLTGVPKSTIKRWATRAGVQPQEAQAAVVAKVQAATEASATARKAKTEEFRQAMVEKTLAVAHRSLDAELKVLSTLREAQQLMTAGGNSTSSQRQILALLEHVPLRELTNARTRAIHDLQLLLGEDTERGAAAPTVVFMQPPAVTADRPPPTIVDLQADAPPVITQLPR